LKFAPFLAILGATTLGAAPASAEPPNAPKLIVAISVDQLSADLFAQYRGMVTGGLKKLQTGVVFSAGYQSHAATETCPGHATILTGSHPARTGIIANNWANPARPRTGVDGKPDFGVYCAEDESVAGSNSAIYTASSVHLKVPTLGDRLKTANPASRVVAVAGKDRAALMMGGHAIDQAWWWGKDGFVTLIGQTGTPPARLASINARAKSLIAKPSKPVLPRQCAGYSRPVAINGGSVGTLVQRKAGDIRALRASPELDQLTTDLALGLFTDMKLGRGSAPDVLAIGLSATDYIGHTYGTAGAEMCNQMVALDATVGRIMRTLDASSVPYVVVLTADHGGHDLPERNRDHAIADASRVDPALMPSAVGKKIGSQLGLTGPILIGDAPFGDIYIAPDVPQAKRNAVLEAAVAAYVAHPQVADVFGAHLLVQMTSPTGSPENWTLAERARASFNPDRSGDLVVLLKPRVTPIPESGLGYVATHGSPWDYDRRVPILFWQKGMSGFEQPNPVDTVDILPTLASLIGLAIAAGEIDGRCLDLDAGPGTTCR
jgi:hypothetical protein